MATGSGYMNMQQAAALLGVSHAKMWRLVKEGVIPAEINPLDRREKRIRRDVLENLRGGSQHLATRPRPRTVGAADLGIQSEDVEEWLEANWRPC